MKEKNNSKPVQTVVIMMLATMLSKVLGLLREMLLASHYGAANTLAEAFSSAQSIPSSFFDVLFSAAIIGCFIPVYNSFGKDREEEADRFACTFLNTILLLTGILAIIGMVFAEPIIALMTPGLDAPTAELAAKLMRIMFPMIIFTGSAYTLVGIMQSKDSYILPALISAISNAGVIVYFLFIDRSLGKNGIYGLAAAYGLSWLIQFATLAIPLCRSGWKFRLVLSLSSPEMKKALKMIPPVMIGSWLMPAGILTGKYFASGFNGVAVFNYAIHTYIMIAGILSYSICNYIFPKLSKLSANDKNGFEKTARSGLLCIWLIIIPFTAALYLLAKEGVCIIYMRGEFDAFAAENTATALKAMAVAMPAFATTEFLSRMFYAEKQTKAPVTSALAGITVNIAMSYILVRMFEGSAASVARANAAGQIAAALVLLIFAFVKYRSVFSKTFIRNFIKIMAGGVLCYAAMYGVYALYGNDPVNAGLLKNIVCAVSVFAAGAAVYVIFAKLCKIRIRTEVRE